MIPPWLVRIGWKSWTLWLPLVLAWPLFLFGLLIVFLSGAMAALFLSGVSIRGLAQVCGGLYRFLCELRGTRVSVDVPEARVVVSFY